MLYVNKDRLHLLDMHFVNKKIMLLLSSNADHKPPAAVTYYAGAYFV